jgi:HPt (histidine-containing phosphotransfer) domain-containing protein
MKKVLLLVGLAIAIFMASTLFSIRNEIRGGNQLLAIKDSYFPVLQRLDADIVRIDKLRDNYMEAAATGDGNLITKATALGTQAAQVLDEINPLYPGRAHEIAALQADMKRYEAGAAAVAQAYVNPSGADLAPMTRKMNEDFAALRDHLVAFRQSAYTGFVDTLASSQQIARVSLAMGLALGLMNLAFMAVLVHFIRRNMAMMTVIAQQNATLERRVAERTAQLSQKTSDINAMLQNMKLGVSTVIPGNLIHPEYSRHMRTIFGVDDIGSKGLVESLLVSSDLGPDIKEQVRTALDAILCEDAMMFEFNSHLLVREMRLDSGDGTQKIVQMDWNPIVNEGGTVEKVLLISQDVTQLRELERSAAAQRDDLDIISRIIRIPIGKFNDFVGSARDFIADGRKLLAAAQGRDAQVIAALFRNMHTIKGNARTFEFIHISNAAHAAERTYDELRKNPAAEWITSVLLDELDAVAASVERYVQINEDKLGRKGRASDLFTTRGSFVGNEQMEALRKAAAALVDSNSSPEAVELKHRIDALGLIDLERLVSGSVDALASLARELNKPAPSVELVDGDVRFTPQFAEALKGCLIHILRNSMDHGIESPEERLRLNKPAQGRIRLGCTRDSDRLHLTISDDGRGLALHKLYAKGIANGTFGKDEKPSPQAIAETIFLAGLSTAEQVTQVSGRGVGMEAVASFMKAQGANVRIELSPTNDLSAAGAALDFAPFTLIIDIPRSAESY